MTDDLGRPPSSGLERDDLEASAIRELALIRERGLRQANNLELDTLRRFALAQHPTKSLPDAIKELLRDAVSGIEEPRIRGSAEWLFGIRPGEMRTPGALREKAATAYGVSRYTFTHRGPEKTVLQALAQVIIAAAQSRARLPETRPRPGMLVRRTWQDRLPRWANGYVHRRALHERLKALLIQHGRAALVGLPGFGKTRLAREMAVELAEEMESEVIWLRGDSDTSMFIDMNSELAARGFGPTEEDDRVVRSFASFVSRLSARLIIVIDNAEVYELIERSIPYHLDAVVLVTARQRLLDEDIWPCLEITEMSTDEAIRLAQQQLPIEVSASDVASLAKALVGYPLAILHAATLLRRAESASVSEFCKALERDAAGVFDSRKRRERALTFIYKALLTRLEQEDVQAADLLKIVATIRLNHIPQALAKGIFEVVGDHRQNPLTQDYGTIEFMKALETLENFVIISFKHRDIEIHQLVQALFRSIIRIGHADIADSVTHGLVRWLTRTGGQSRTDTVRWWPTIAALVEKAQGRNLWGDNLVRLGKLSTMMVAAISPGLDNGLLSEVKQTWFYKWVTSDTHQQSDALASLRYDWLCLSDSSYDRIILAGLTMQNVTRPPLNSNRKSSIADLHEWKANYDRPPLSWISADGSLHLLEPIHDDIRVSHEILISGNAYEAQRRVSSFLANAALAGAASNATRLAAYFLLVEAALRRLDISAARHYLDQAWEQLDEDDSDVQSSLQVGRAHLLAGDMEHLTYLKDGGKISAARQHYEKARSSYMSEMIPVSRFEAERKLACLAAHSNMKHARSRLQNLQLQAQAPLHLPTYHRIALSLAKLAVLCQSVRAEDLDYCWEAADFYSSPPIRDRFWYLESLVTACCVNAAQGLQEPDRSLLDNAIWREAQSIGREDKARLTTIVATSLRSGRGGENLRLLAD